VGYERTSMRTIAARAQVNATVLHYYFEGKRGLYFSCVEHINLRARQLLQDVVVQARQAIAPKTSRAELIEAVCVIYERSADYLLTTRELEIWYDFMGWDNHNVPAESRKILEQGLRQDFMQLMWDLIGRITGKGSTDVDTRIRALTLGAQLAVFELAPRRSLNDLGWSVVDEPALKKLKAIIREQTEAALREA
jgi:AcrR family transcriptional regulator